MTVPHLDHDNPPPSPFAGIPCRECGHAELRLEMRPRLISRPLGTWSLSGAQIKTSAREIQWPWCVCDHCGAESEGKQ